MSSNLIGGIGLTHLQVYDQRPGPDGVKAGCAHIHGLTEEAYLGISGEGAVELHDLEHGFRTLAIRKGSYVQFPPGTLHRSVSYASLEVIAIMGNGGLAERGDARIYFGAAIDADTNHYERLKNLSTKGLDGALERRDASARAYQRLMHLWETDRDAYSRELQRFFDLHRRNLTTAREAMREAINSGPLASGQTALARLQTLPDRDRTAAAITTTDAGGQGVTLGMCGILRQIVDPAPLSEAGH